MLDAQQRMYIKLLVSSAHKPRWPGITQFTMEHTCFQHTSSFLVQGCILMD